MKIAVLLSGGVDSSVALRILKDQGHEVTAFYLKIWLEDELSYLGNCPWEEDLKHARAVCKQADVPLEIMPMQREYFDHVVQYTLTEVKAGRTPNPDIFCNKLIKFGFFFDKITGYDKIATGHYAQIEEQNSQFLLKQAPDPIKDQTYFLSKLTQNQLRYIIFPIGHLAKTAVRQLAQKYDLPNKDRKDSQGICFLGKFEFRDFLNHYLGEQPGDLIEHETGQKIGEHRGFWYYTIGQRKDIRLSGGPWYVVSKDISKNQVFISNNYHDPQKKRNSFSVTDFNWISGHRPHKANLKVKLRHGEQIYNCTLQDKLITLDKQDQGIASGQFAAFYDETTCLGSARIAESS